MDIYNAITRFTQAYQLVTRFRVILDPPIDHHRFCRNGF